MKVVESERAPKTRQSPAGLFIPLEEKRPSARAAHHRGAGATPIVPSATATRGRICCVCPGWQHCNRAKRWSRRARSRRRRVRPVHGPDLEGLDDVPGIADRTASYPARQLYNISRREPAESADETGGGELNADDIIAIAAVSRIALFPKLT